MKDTGHDKSLVLRNGPGQSRIVTRDYLVDERLEVQTQWTNWATSLLLPSASLRVISGAVAAALAKKSHGSTLRQEARAGTHIFLRTNKSDGLCVSA
jgi:hypothetical protein